MATRRQRIWRDAYKTVYIAKVGSTADRDTAGDDYMDEQNINVACLAGWCPKMAADAKA